MMDEQILRAIEVLTSDGWLEADAIEQVARDHDLTVSEVSHVVLDYLTMERAC